MRAKSATQIARKRKRKILNCLEKLNKGHLAGFPLTDIPQTQNTTHRVHFSVADSELCRQNSCTSQLKLKAKKPNPIVHSRINITKKLTKSRSNKP